MAGSVRPYFSPMNAQVGVNASTGGPDVSGNVNVGFNPINGQVGVKPTLQIGNDQGSQTGGKYGGIGGQGVGMFFGGPVGGAVGSVVGSGLGSAIGGQFGPGKIHQEGEDRKQLLGAFQQGGLLGENLDYTFPDGSTFNFGEDTEHGWKYQDKRVDKIGDRNLRNYEIDYTNDTDYVAGMAGISLSRLLAGGKGKAIDQTGNAFGNAFLGKVGYGSDLSSENFSSVMKNARSVYAQSGVQSKEDMLALANKALSDGRINDTDYAVMQQTAGLVFDNDFNKANSLMAGRWKGVQTASGAPPATRQNKPGRIYSPVISPAEAMLSVQPYFDAAAKNQAHKPKSTFMSTLKEGIGVVTAGIGAYGGINKATGGKLGDAIGGLFGGSETPGADAALGDHNNIEAPFSFDPYELDIF